MGDDIFQKYLKTKTSLELIHMWYKEYVVKDGKILF